MNDYEIKFRRTPFLTGLGGNIRSVSDHNSSIKNVMQVATPALTSDKLSSFLALEIHVL